MTWVRLGYFKTLAIGTTEIKSHSLMVSEEPLFLTVSCDCNLPSGKRVECLNKMYISYSYTITMNSEHSGSVCEYRITLNNNPPPEANAEGLVKSVVMTDIYL